MTLPGYFGELGGYLKPQGSWGSKTSEILDKELPSLIEGYLKNLGNHYQGKKEAVKIYLLKYYLDWQSQM